MQEVGVVFFAVEQSQTTVGRAACRNLVFAALSCLQTVAMVKVKALVEAS